MTGDNIETVPRNIFVRFKQHVDNNIASGVDTLLGHLSKSELAECSVEKNRCSKPPAQPGVMDPLHDKVAPVAANNDDSWPSQLDIVSLSLSPYAPSVLRSLPQPIPQDAPSNLDSSVFTFEDALEDLISISQGRPLPTIESRHKQRTLLSQMFPDGEPTWFWLKRLQSQGLVRHPASVMSPGSLRPHESALLKELQQISPSIWQQAVSEIGIESTILQFMKNLGDDFANIRKSSVAQPSNQGSVASGDVDRRPEPANLDEVFATISSDFSEGQKTWDVFLKQISQSNSMLAEKQLPADRDSSLNSETNTTETTNEYVDLFGYKHSKLTRIITDNKGFEVGRETHHVVRRAEDYADKNSAEESRLGAISHDLRFNENKPGWFWK